MTMTPEEICRDYKLAKKKQTQIGILADLNQCEKREIVRILAEAGMELPGTYNKKKPAPKAAAANNVEKRDLVGDLQTELKWLKIQNEELRECIIRLTMKLMGVRSD